MAIDQKELLDRRTKEHGRILPGEFGSQEHDSKKIRSGKMFHGLILLKAISWRVVGTIDTILLSWIITQRLDLSLKIGAVELFTKIALFYVHERAWKRFGSI